MFFHQYYIAIHHNQNNTVVVASFSPPASQSKLTVTSFVPAAFSRGDLKITLEGEFDS
jgi:hypothetical protein